MRRNTDETQRDLERQAREGDQRAALKLLAEWQRTGEVGVGGAEFEAELDDKRLGRIELVFTFPPTDGVKRDITFAMTFRDVRRRGRARGFIVNGYASSADDFAWALASYGSLSRAAGVQDVVAATKQRGSIDIGSILWPESYRSEVPGYSGSFEELHSTVRVVLDEFWSDPEYRANLIEILMKARLAHRAARLAELRKQFESIEEDAAMAVDEELRRRAGQLDFWPPVEDEG
jgi:hypothetical protein